VKRLCQLILLGLTTAALAPATRAEEGQLEINQRIALAGGMNGNLATDPPGFPVVITEPGSYRLTSDLANPSSSNHAILIAGDDVTIDLGGFTIRGRNAIPPGSCASFGTANGILGQGGNIGVRNGRIRGMAATGINIPGAGARVEQLQVADNCSSGIVLGAHALVDEVQAAGNGGNGIRCGAASQVTNSTAERNGPGSGGIFVGSDSIVAGSIGVGNQSSGIRTDAGSLAVYNAASLNTSSGTLMGIATNALGNVSNQNGAWGAELSTTSAAGLNELDGNAFGGFLSGIPSACNVVNGVPGCPTPP
jgi:hypothetical protein